MTTLIKVLITSILGVFMTSCNFNFNIGTKGNGNVQTIERTINGNYDQIEVSNGLDVFLTQGDTDRISVQADENLHDIIKTEVIGNTLKIYTNENISSSQSQKVMVSFRTLSKISAASGSDVYATNKITVESLKLETSSGSDMTLDVSTNSIDCESASGSDLKLSGSTVSFKAQASSGSNIHAGDLTSNSAHVSASSGADITVKTLKVLVAKALSGGEVSYIGTPEKIEKTKGVSGM